MKSLAAAFAEKMFYLVIDGVSFAGEALCGIADFSRKVLFSDFRVDKGKKERK